MNILNGILNPVADFVFAVLGVLPAAVALVVLSAVSGVLMTAAFRYTSNQKGLRRVADRTRASLLAMKLFKDDFGVAVRSQGRLMVATGLRLWYSLPPMLVMMAPFVLLLSQTAQRYEFRRLRVGEPVSVVMQFSEAGWDQHGRLQLTVPEGIAIDRIRRVGEAPAGPTPPVRDERAKSITWRLRASEPGEHTLAWTLGDETIEKRVVVGDESGLAGVSVLRPGTSFWDRLLYPLEAGFGADSPVQSIELHYSPETRVNRVFGFGVHWLVTFFVVSILFALIARPFLKVQF